MKKFILYTLLLVAFPFYFTGCKKEVRPTTMAIKDSVRHYYPIKQGQQLDIMFTVTNTGDAPLIISEMQPSCGCIILDKSSHIIIPEDGIRQFKATYNSIKNVGEVIHRIRIFGNMLPHGKAELKFDVNVVPDADYTRDYEELFQEFNAKNGIIREIVDGKESELGYYVGTP
jgi:Protein of unknown function (DUF1573).